MAREVFRCPIPVVSAIGHERDVTIVDYVADLRASTPSNAAELIVPHRQALKSEVKGLADQMDSAISRRLMMATHDLDRATQYFVAMVERQSHVARLMMRRFLSTLPRLQTRPRLAQDELHRQARRLQRSIDGLSTRQREALRTRQQLLQSLDPKRLLERGYSIVRHGGRVVKSVNDVAIREALDITLRDGHLGVDIKEKHHD